jgi:hypothetical protein
MKVVRRARHASVQDTAVHDLQREIDRKHGFLRFGRRKAASVRPGATGHWRPVTHRAKRILAQLRKTKVWRLQKQLVRELAAELRNGRRRIDKIRARARKIGAPARRHARRAGRWAGRNAARGVQAARPPAERAGRLVIRVFTPAPQAAPRRSQAQQQARPPRAPGASPARGEQSGRPNRPPRYREPRIAARTPRTARPVTRSR